jgi:hypothetical protein
MAWTFSTKAATTFVNKAKQFLYYFWGTHDNDYVVDHLGRKIIFFDYSPDWKDKETTVWSHKSK